MLYMVPTPTSDNIGSVAVVDGAVYNITGCTFNIASPNNGTLNGVFDEAGYLAACSAVRNATIGTVINPVQSARLSTRNSTSIWFGRVECRTGELFFMGPIRHDLLISFFFENRDWGGEFLKSCEIIWHLAFYCYGPHYGCFQQRMYTVLGH